MTRDSNGDGKAMRRESDTADQMGALATGMIGKRLRYRELVS